MNSMNARLPAEEAAFQKRLAAVRTALSSASKVQQGHVRAQMLALRELASQIDALSDSASMSLLDVRGKVSQVLSEISALDAKRKEESVVSHNAIRSMVGGELGSMQQSLGKDMQDVLAEMRAAIQRNGTSLDSRILSAAKMISAERAGSEERLRTFEREMQQQVLDFF